LPFEHLYLLSAFICVHRSTEGRRSLRLIMDKLKLSTISKQELEHYVKLEERGIENYSWLEINAVELTAAEKEQIKSIQAKLLNYPTHLMNEATIWARGIYPFLVLAERDKIQAWAEVNLQAQYAKFEIDAIVDGVLGRCVDDVIEAPLLVVVEAKRGLDNQNPLAQLYGQLLAGAYLNWQEDRKEPQIIFGCYTIADIWTFIRAEVGGIEEDVPSLMVESSREYGGKWEGETICCLLKQIVAPY